MENVAKRIIKAKEAGNKVVVVLSARGDFTEELLSMAHTANPHGSKRERDALVSIGEQMSVTLMALTLQKMGCFAKSLNATQAGIMSTADFSTARIKRIKTQKIENELNKGNVVLVTGFQGVTAEGDVTTLGRGGSDTTAVALAAALQASVCEIYTDVEGVYSADPRIVPNAKKLPEITYLEMLELSALGAKVLQKRSVGLAKKYGVKLMVLSSLSEASGTLIKEEDKVENIFVSGVVSNKDIARVSISGIVDAPGVWFKVFSIMKKKDISIDFVEQRKMGDGTKDISFTIDLDRLEDTKDILQKNINQLSFEEMSHETNLAKLSVVSTGVATNPGVPSLMFEALFDAGINIDSISTSEIKISVLVDVEDMEKATKALHDRFLEENFIR
ncbi:MAG: aspartate kinase [Defluviitaleaceae bacterium]|nr:aspartate kinase [Defluviitaleaceae bacterium]